MMPRERKQPRDQAYYDAIKAKFAEERDLRLRYRPEGTAQFTSDFSGELEKYAIDAFADEWEPRDPIEDTVEVAFIGGGFSALLTSARLREQGVESIRIIERGADVGGTWYWNRYPGVACDVVSYDYLPLLDEMDYVPKDHYAKGPEILAHCQAIARKYNLYDLAVFQTTVTSTTWDEEEQLWHLRTNRGDHMRAQFVICANGTLSKPKLAKIDGLESFRGPLLSHFSMGLRLLRRQAAEPRGQGGWHHRHRCNRRASHPRARRQRKRAVRLSAHALVHRHPRGLAHRPQLGPQAETRLASQAPRRSAEGTGDGIRRGRRAQR